MAHIFISYSRKDQTYAYQLAEDIRQHGFDVWMDDRSIHYGSNWERTIFKGIDECAAFVVIMTPQSYDSAWVQRECQHAENRKKPPFPVLLKGEVFPRYNLTQFANGHGGKLPDESFYHDLAQAVVPLNQIGQMVAPKSVLLKSKGHLKWVYLGAVGLAATVLIGIAAFSGSDETGDGGTPEIATAIPALKLALQGVNSNDEWTPYTQTFDAVEMVLVPVGCFRMGNDPEGTSWDGNAWVMGMSDGGERCFEQPFWIDKYEVTNEQFDRLNGQTSNLPDGEQFPRTSVTWFEARDFCALRGGRLPTEAEWEYTTRGVDALVFPWGNTFAPHKVVSGDNGQVAEVGSCLDGISWVGTLDMSGNVWEWVSSLYQAYPYTMAAENLTDTISFRVLRGGAWDSTYPADFRGSFRGWLSPGDKDNTTGFRCARDFEG